MKKIILYTSVIGLVIGVAAYLLNKKNKSNASKIQPIDNEFVGLEPNTSNKEAVYEPDPVEKMTEIKSSSVHTIHNRHIEAADSMCNALENIYKDIDPVVCDEKKVDSVIVESVIINNDLDSISDELDNLLK